MTCRGPEGSAAIARRPATAGAQRAVATAVLVGALTAAAAAGASEIALGELRGSLPLDFTSSAASHGALRPTLLPPVELRSLLRLVHLMGLCLGFGTALFLDLNTLLWLREGRVPQGARELLRRGEQLVAIGFAVLWASGIALVGLALQADPDFLSNPKLWAKILVVLALSANAAVLHLRVLPVFSASLGRRIDGNWRRRERALFIACGAVSAASWSTAAALGVIREWNHVAGMGPLVALWLAFVCAAAAAIRFLLPRASPTTPYRGGERRNAGTATSRPRPRPMDRSEVPA